MTSLLPIVLLVMSLVAPLLIYPTAVRLYLQHRPAVPDHVARHLPAPPAGGKWVLTQTNNEGPQLWLVSSTDTWGDNVRPRPKDLLTVLAERPPLTRAPVNLIDLRLPLASALVATAAAVLAEDAQRTERVARWFEAEARWHQEQEQIRTNRAALRRRR